VKASRTHDGDEEPVITELARLLPVPAERDLPAGRMQTRKEHMMSELRQAGRTSTSAGPSTPPGPRRRRPSVLAAAVVGGAAAVTAVVVVLATLPGHAGHAGHHGQARASAAVQLLDKIAAAAGRQPARQVRDSQYVYIASLVQQRPPQACLIVNGVCQPMHTRTAMPRPHKRQIWIPVANLCLPGLLREPAAGLANMTLQDTADPCPNRGSLNDPTYRFLQSLPTDPHKLLNLIYVTEKGHGTGPAQEAFTTIGDLLRESIAPPQVSAALYRAAALIPGVTLLPDAVDVRGQHGVAVSFTSDGNRNEWIFNKRTLQWMGDLGYTGKKLEGGSAILVRAIVDRPGQLPAGR